MILYCARHLLPIGSPGIEDGALLVDDARIIAVGKRRELAAAHADVPVVDFGESVILPPLVNAHTHLELSGFPDWSAAMQDCPAADDFVGWIQHLVKVKSRLPRESYAAAIRSGIRTCLRSGCAAVGDILSVYSGCEAYRDTPLLGRVYFEILGQDVDTARQQLATLDALFEKGPFGRLTPGLSPHAPYTLAPAVLDVALFHACERRWPVTMHLGESPDEVTFLESATGTIAERLYPWVGWQDRLPDASGLRPVAYLLQHAPLPQPFLMAHGVQVGEGEVLQLKRSGVSVVLCPRSNARLGVGRAPVAAYRQAGVPLALGTDSLASCPSLSVWDELAFAREWFAGALSPHDWLAIATAGGAAALGLSQRLGTLASNCEASFQVVTAPDGATAGSLCEALCSSGGATRVAALYIAGENVLPSQ